MVKYMNMTKRTFIKIVVLVLITIIAAVGIFFCVRSIIKRNKQIQEITAATQFAVNQSVYISKFLTQYYPDQVKAFDQANAAPAAQSK